jgi:hypothetical protein
MEPCYVLWRKPQRILDRQDLLGHRSTRVTTDCSAAELRNLLSAANRLKKSRKSPAMARRKATQSTVSTMNGRPSRLPLAVHPQQSTVARLVMLSGRVGFLAAWQSRRGLLSPITVFAVIARTILVVRTSLFRIRLRVIGRTTARALLSHSSILSGAASLILADMLRTLGDDTPLSGGPRRSAYPSSHGQ